MFPDTPQGGIQIKEPDRCCCGCCTVAQGTLLIAISDTIGSIWAIFWDTLEIMGMVSNHEEETFPDFEEKIYLVTYFIGLVMSLGYLVVSMMLLMGWGKRNPTLCRPWLVCNYCVLILLSIGLLIILLAIAFQSIGMANEVFPKMSVFLGMHLYFVNLVQRFVDELKERADGERSLGL